MGGACSRNGENWKSTLNTVENAEGKRPLELVDNIKIVRSYYRKWFHVLP
jgi:hypothetical protein